MNTTKAKDAKAASTKTMKAKSMKAASNAMTKKALINFIAIQSDYELPTKEISQIFDSLAAIAVKEIKQNGVFTVPGICRINLKTKPATKACTRNLFGAEFKVKAKKARTIVTSCPVIGLKRQLH